MTKVSPKDIQQAIGKKILHNKAILASYRLDTAKPAVQLPDWRERLIEIYADHISQATDFMMLRDWCDQFTSVLISEDLSIRLAIEQVKVCQDAVETIMIEEAKYNALSYTDFYSVIKDFNSLANQAGLYLSECYITHYVKKYNEFEQLVKELSTPIVQISDQIAIIPIIGTLDEERADSLIETALYEGRSLGVRTMLIDLSGVPIVDTMVAGILVNLNEALSVIGIQVILSGIRPELAQKLVQLNINFRSIHTFATLYRAIQFLKKAN
ncbi:rsbT co-antagonist protein RsbR [Amphibacillus marinus]|uniref:RsbT co-antagonist protein RsbR n=1 Tax=Amphibacillus marinus TaxID=872970 RepID=A0A1H8M946_9BACI|nr:STAS domain-containing protein [Amphibacillus marinus]SEO13881.1 rsbT co-antagonist protein RsbR [Amphibacillus marinus]